MPDATSEAQLLTAARAGDQRAFGLLMRRHRDRIWGICLRVTGDHTDAADATQDCLVAIWRNLDRFRGDSAFSTWTFRIASNAALAVVRRRQAEATLPLDGIDAPDHGFEHAVVTRDQVAIALRAVPADFRAALVLREYGMLSYEEIAAHQCVPVQTVKSRLHRARAAVRAALADLD